MEVYIVVKIEDYGETKTIALVTKDYKKALEYKAVYSEPIVEDPSYFQPIYDIQTYPLVD